jgi:hypothetical protein
MSFSDMAMTDNKNFIASDGVLTTLKRLSPANTFSNIPALVNFIGFNIDPGTGAYISGDNSSITINLSELNDNGLSIYDFKSDKNNWMVTIPVYNQNIEMKIMDVIADRQFAVTLILELVVRK